jgi:hypothetical protein
MQSPGTRIMRFRPIMLKVKPNHEHRWLGQLYLLQSIACGISLPIHTSYLAPVVLPSLMFALRFFLGFRSVFLILASVRSWQLTGVCAQRHQRALVANQPHKRVLRKYKSLSILIPSIKSHNDLAKFF